MDLKPGIESGEWINLSGPASPLDPGRILSEDAEYKESIN